jgi:hypothetical protein
MGAEAVFCLEGRIPDKRSFYKGICVIDYCFSSETALTRGIWMPFFDTEEAHAVMLAYAANGSPVDHRSSGPGSSGKSRLKAPAQFGAKKDIHIPQ